MLANPPVKADLHHGLLAAAHLAGRPILFFSPEPWGDIAFISHLAIPGALLLVGYFTFGFAVGLTVKAISMFRHR
jgi:hypothetical protein